MTDDTDNRDRQEYKEYKDVVHKYLHQHIPLGTFMQIRVVKCNQEKTVLLAPLAPNLNDKGIAFGGSLSVLATLAAWAKIYEYTLRQDLKCDLLISHAETNYLKPGREELVAICDDPGDDEWLQFERIFTRKGRGRIALNSRVECGDDLVLEMTAQFAAVKKS